MNSQVKQQRKPQIKQQKSYKKRKKKKKHINWKNLSKGLLVLFLLVLGSLGYSIEDWQKVGIQNAISNYASTVPSGVKEYDDATYIVLQDNIPNFTAEELAQSSFEFYSELDSFGRCGTAVAMIGQELMPTEERESIGQVKPTGWHTVKYDVVDGKYLYNRCHLIGYQLTGENANEKNLITGTRFLNVEGMLPFENMVAEYIQFTGNHVLYRVTPIFEGENLLASGVQMEAMSVEDAGTGICFNVYISNAQPGVIIDYSSGESYLAPL